MRLEAGIQYICTRVPPDDFFALGQIVTLDFDGTQWFLRHPGGMPCSATYGGIKDYLMENFKKIPPRDILLSKIESAMAEFRGALEKADPVLTEDDLVGFERRVVRIVRERVISSVMES